MRSKSMAITYYIALPLLINEEQNRFTLTVEQGLINHYYTTDSTQLQKMSDADTKSSLGSETDSAEKERLRCMQRIMVEQQQHLLSQYQNKKNSASGQNEGKVCDDFTEIPIQQSERTKSALKITAQQQSLLHDIKEKTEDDNNYSTSSDLGSMKAFPSEKEAPDKQQVPGPLKGEFSLETTLSSSVENPKQKHLDDKFAGREISSRDSKSSQESGSKSSSAHGTTTNTKTSSLLGEPSPLSHSSWNAWRRLEEELEEYFSDVDIQDESRPQAAITAQLKPPPETFLTIVSGADSTHVRLGGGNHPGHTGSGQVLPQRLGREYHHDKDNMDDRKPPAASQDNDDDDDVL